MQVAEKHATHHSEFQRSGRFELTGPLVSTTALLVVASVVFLGLSDGSYASWCPGKGWPAWL